MSSYQAEFQLGYNQGIEAGRVIANQMYQDGYEKGLHELKTYDDNEITANETLSQLFKHLGIDDPKLVKKYVGYVMAEANA